MANKLPVTESGEESSKVSASVLKRMFSPNEAPLPSSLNGNPITGGLQMVFVRGYFRPPVFGSLANGEKIYLNGNVSDEDFPNQLEYKSGSGATNPHFFKTIARRWYSESRELSVSGPWLVWMWNPDINQWVIGNDWAPSYTGTRVQSQGGAGRFPAVSVTGFETNPFPGQGGSVPASDVFNTPRDFSLSGSNQSSSWSKVSFNGTGEISYAQPDDINDPFSSTTTITRTISKAYSLTTEYDAKPDIDALLAVIQNQNLASVWAGTPTGGLDAYLHCYPGQMVGTQFYSDDFAGVGTTRIYGPTPPRYPAFTFAIDEMLALRNVNSGTPRHYTGSIGQRTFGATPVNLIGINQPQWSAVNLNFIDRVQVKALTAMDYTIFEMMVAAPVTVRQGSGTRIVYQSKNVFRRISTGTLQPNEILELPAPSRTDIPFVARGACAQELRVGFLPFTSLDAYAASLDSATLGITHEIFEGSW